MPTIINDLFIGLFTHKVCQLYGVKGAVDYRIAENFGGRKLWRIAS